MTVASTREIGSSRTRSDPDSVAARVLNAIALSSIGAGAINLAAAATVGRSALDTLAFFVAAGAALIAWGALALVRAPRWWLALGAAGNLGVAVTWVVTRTVGLPFGTVAGRVLPVGFPDGLATAFEAMVVVGVAVLLARAAALTRPAMRSPGTTAATAVVVGALALVGVLAQTGVIGSSTSGNAPAGGGTPSYGNPANGGPSYGGPSYGAYGY